MAFDKVYVTCGVCKAHLGSIKIETKRLLAMTKIIFLCKECRKQTD